MSTPTSNFENNFKTMILGSIRAGGIFRDGSSSGLQVVVFYDDNGSSESQNETLLFTSEEYQNFSQPSNGKMNFSGTHTISFTMPSGATVQSVQFQGRMSNTTLTSRIDGISADTWYTLANWSNINIEFPHGGSFIVNDIELELGDI